MKFDVDSFNEVELNTLTSNPCSPKEPDPHFLGILINAPKKVIFTKEPNPEIGESLTVIPICGYHMLTMEYQAKFVDIRKAMRLIAVNKETSLELSGKAIKPLEDDPDQKRPKLTPEQIKGKVTGGYFNSDLIERVTLPAMAGTYDVHVELGELDSEDYLQSNIITIELSEEE